jgi:hypothetical protein
MRFINWILLWFLPTLAFAGTDFCAVRLEIVNPVGKPMTAPVELIDAEGRVVQNTKAPNGKVEFCDLGFGEHTIRIGGDQCGFVTLHRIRFVYGVAQYFRVVLNDCMIGGDGGTFPPSCLVYFRVSSEAGKKLSDAQADTEGGVYAVRADSYGRIFTFVLNGKSQEFVISSPGYASRTVHVSCRSYDHIAEAVVLHPN